MIDEYVRVYSHYVTRATQVARGVVLKTDAFNECGRRWWAVPIVDKLNCESVTCVEIDGARAAICKENYPFVDVVCGDLADVDFPRKFDTILDLSTIDHIRRWERVLENYSRWIKPGGKILLFAWLSEEFQDLGVVGSSVEFSLPKEDFEWKLRSMFSVECNGALMTQPDWGRELVEYTCEGI